MKKGCLAGLFSVLLIAGAAVGLYLYKYPNYTYRYRLTVDVEIDGQLHSGSSVIEVTWHGGPEIADSGGYGPTVRGQAAVVDLTGKGVLVAALANGERWGAPDTYGGPWGALWLFPRAFTKERRSMT